MGWRPQRRGSIRLSGPDPDDPLLIDLNAFEVPADLESLEASLTQVREIAAAPALRDECGASELYPGRDVRTPAHVRDYVRRTAITYHHQVGTCPMGIDPDAVVDPRLRVHGIEGCAWPMHRSCPVVTSGNTNTPSLMIGERAADFITGGSQSAAPTSLAAPSAPPDYLPAYLEPKTA